MTWGITTEYPETNSNIQRHEKAPFGKYEALEMLK